MGDDLKCIIIINIHILGKASRTITLMTEIICLDIYFHFTFLIMLQYLIFLLIVDISYICIFWDKGLTYIPGYPGSH